MYLSTWSTVLDPNPAMHLFMTSYSYFVGGTLPITCLVAHAANTLVSSTACRRSIIRETSCGVVEYYAI